MKYTAAITSDCSFTMSLINQWVLQEFGHFKISAAVKIQVVSLGSGERMDLWVITEALRGAGKYHVFEGTKQNHNK